MWWMAAAAQAQVSFDAVTRVQAGTDDPSISFHSAVDGKLTVKLSCDGHSYDRVLGVKADGTSTIALTGLSPGEHACAGGVRLDQPSGEWATSDLKFTVALLGALKLQATLADVDLAHHHLVVHADRPLSEAAVDVIGAGGAVLAHETAVLVDPQNPSFSWVADGEAIKLVVTAADQAKIRGQVELSPWSYAIPHDDVVFASGSAEIPAGEVPKLERCWSDLQGVLAKYGSVVDVELFVAGYTDTVGAPASNQALSERRAAAIAGWFAQRGFHGSVWYQGFGESVLRVATPDETDRAENRRALYLLAADAPAVGPDFPKADWHRR